METIKGYDIPNETKKNILYVRVTDAMNNELKSIRRKTGVPISEIIRESLKQTLIEISESGSIKFKIQ